MPFPTTKRVKFHSNPLVEVVCQLNFLGKLYNSEEGFSKEASLLHDKLKTELPFFNKAKTVSVEIDSANQNVNKTEIDVFEFASDDQKYKLVISPDSLALVTTDYNGWEAFSKLLEFTLKNLNDYPVTKTFKRVGLRYKDVIQRSQLDIDLSTSWSELLNDNITCLLRSDDIANQIKGIQTNFTMSLPDIDKRSHMNANYGLVSHADTKEICFLIDSDFYVEGEINNDSSTEFLDAFNIKSRNFFQWCIKEQLYRNLKPEEI